MPLEVYSGQRKGNRSPRTFGYGVTWKATLLKSVPLGVVTSTVPVVAPVGTAVVISVAETTVYVAAVPLKVTLVAPVRLVPRILTLAPAFAPAGTVFINAPSPTFNLYTVPSF